MSHIPANIITFLSLISCILATISLIFHQLFFTLICIFLIEFFDQLDGVIARIQGSTILGAFLDSTLDRYGDAILIVGLVVGKYTTPFWGLFCLIGAFLTSYTRARIEALGVNSLGGIGLLERTDRIPILFIGTLLQIWIPTALFWTIIVLSIGAHFTAIQRITFAVKNLPSKE